MPHVVIVGNGLFGSAAGRHMTELGDRVTIIGPGEPVDPSTHAGSFSSHYDEGRLVSRFGRDRVWAALSRRAIDGFPDLEARSHIDFHRPVGRLSAVSKDHDRRRVDARGLRMYPAGDTSWRSAHPDIDVPDHLDVFIESAPAGYVNPRALIRAQNTVAVAQGASVVTDRVVGVSASSTGVDITTDAGRSIRADCALVAAGAFTNFGALLPSAIPLRLKTETTIRGSVSIVTAERLSGLPVVTWEIDDPDIDDIYLAPPIEYPDGIHRIKMGCNTKHEAWPETFEAVQRWFRSGLSDLDLPPMAAALRRLLPGVEFDDVATHRCIVAYTPSGHPTIDHAPGDETGRLFVAAGGNGTGAQGSDTIGLLAAGLVHDHRWIDGFDRERFRVGAGQPADTA